MAKRPGEYFKWVNPRGGFFQTSGQVGAAPSTPTYINFRSLGVGSLKYVGLYRIGFMKPGVDYPESNNSLWVRERYSDNRFEIFDESHFLLTPDLGSRAYICDFGPDDSYYSDNQDLNGDYGVVVSYLNVRPPNYAVLVEEIEVTEEPEDGAIKTSVWDINDLPQNNFASPQSVTVHDQYRGWYSTRAWLPRYSRFHGRPGGGHNGIDLFAHYGSDVKTPVTGRLLFNPFSGGPNNPSLGRTSVVESNIDGRVVYVVFAHLSANVGRANAIVRAGAVVGRAGHSGNAKADNNPYDFRHRNPWGGRSDHVHIDVRKKLNAKRGDFLDPVRTLRLSVSSP